MSSGSTSGSTGTSRFLYAPDATGASGAPAPASVPTVSELTRDIKSLLETTFPDVRVEGEISQPKTSNAGHIYLTLKDVDAQLPCVIWRSTASRISMTPEHGQQVIASGEVQVYPPHGRYQLIIRSLEPSGLGALQQAFEQLKNKLQKEGLFDASRKQELPRFPMRIGMVTSQTGAAFQDMKATLEKRFPLALIRLYHASVQGANAAPEIVRGIRYFAAGEDPVDLIIAGRGGGSMEDLWPFNEESVARALYECPIPTVSAVGHETDFSISDFTADARAATPTQAITMSVPDINELRFALEDQHRRMQNTIEQRLRSRREKVEYFQKNHALMRIKEVAREYRSQLQNLDRRLDSGLRMLVMKRRDRLQQVQDRLAPALHFSLVHRRETLQQLSGRLEKKDPMEPLERGFTRVMQQGRWVRRKEELGRQDALHIEWKDGQEKVRRHSG